MFNVSGDNVSHYSYINKNLYNRYSNLYDHQYKKMSYNTFKKGNLSNRYNLVAYDNLYNIHLSNINKSNITSVISKSNYTSSALSIAHHYSKRKKSKYVTKIDFYIPNRLISIYNLYNKKIVKSIRNLLKHELKVKY